MSCARGGDDRIFGSRQMISLQEFLQAGLGILAHLLRGQPRQDRVVEFQDNALRRIKTGFAKNSAENRFHGIGKNRRTMCAARLYLTFPHVEEA